MRIVRRLSAALLSAALIFPPAGELLAQDKVQDAPSAAPSATAAEPAKPPTDQADDKSAVVPAANPVFPSVVDPKYVHELGPLGRMRTCADQFTANKATNSNGGMKWIDRSGGYYRECSKRLKG